MVYSNMSSLISWRRKKSPWTNILALKPCRCLRLTKAKRRTWYYWWGVPLPCWVEICQTTVRVIRLLLFVINVICCWWHANLSVDFIKMKLCWNVVRSLGNKHKYYLAYNNIQSTYLLSLFWIDGKKRPQQTLLQRTCSECFIVCIC